MAARLQILELLLMRRAFQMSSSSHQMCQMWKACGEASSAGTRITQPRTKWLKDTVVPIRERTWRIEHLEFDLLLLSKTSCLTNALHTRLGLKDSNRLEVKRVSCV